MFKLILFLTGILTIATLSFAQQIPEETQLEELVKSKATIGFAELPGISDIVINQDVKDFLNKLTITKPIIEKKEGTVRLWGEVTIFGMSVMSMFQISVTKGGSNISFFVILPKTNFAATLPALSFLDNFPLSDIVLGISKYGYSFKAKTPKSDLEKLKESKVEIGSANGSDDEEEEDAETEVESVPSLEVRGMEILNGKAVKNGLNLFATLTLDVAPFNHISDLLGEQLNVVELRGSIPLKVAGTLFKAKIPGEITFIPSMRFGKLVLIITLASNYMPTIKISSLLTIDTEEFKDLGIEKPITMKSGFALTPKDLTLWSDTKSKINLPTPLPSVQVALEQVVLSGTIDWAQFLATKFPISSIGFGGIISLLTDRNNPDTKKTFETKLKFGSKGFGELLILGRMAGVLSIKEIFDILANEMQEYSGTDLHALYSDKIPAISVKDTELIIVPKDVTLAGKKYSQQIKFMGEIEIAGTKGGLELEAGLPAYTSGKFLPNLFAKGYVNTIDIGRILRITGYTPDKPAQIEIRIDQQVIYSFIISGKLAIDALGLNFDTNINLRADGIDIKTTQKLFGKYDADLEIRASIPAFLAGDSNNFYIKCFMKQDLLSFIENEMMKFAQQLVPGFNRDAQRELDRVNNEIARLTKERDDYYYREIAPHMQNCLRMGQEKVQVWPFPAVDKYPAFKTESGCWAFYGEIINRAPFYNGKNVEIKGLEIYREGLLKPGTQLIQGTLSAVTNITNLAAWVLGRGINIESFSLDGSLAELFKEGKLAKVDMRLKFAGKTIELRDLQFSFTDIPGSMTNIFNELLKLVK